MASIRQWHNGYQVRWRDPAGRQRTKSFKRKTDAKQFANRVEVEMQRGTYVDPQLGKLLFANWANEWLQTKINLRASSWTRDESYLRNHVMPTFGDIALAKIDKLLVQAWVRDLVTKGFHPSTIKECYRILRGVMNEAADARLIVESPCRKVTLPRVPKTEQRYLTAAQVEQLVAATDPQFRVLVMSAGYLGARWGELVGVKRQHLNLLKREVRIVGTLEEVPGGVRYVEETKTSASRRTLDIPAFLVHLLAAHLKDAPESQFVFCTMDGSPIRRSNPATRVEAGGQEIRDRSGLSLPRPAAYVRIAPHRARRPSQGDPGAARSLQHHYDSRPLRTPDAGSRPSARGESRRDAQEGRFGCGPSVDQRRCGDHRVPVRTPTNCGSTCGNRGWAVLGSNQ